MRKSAAQRSCDSHRPADHLDSAHSHSHPKPSEVGSSKRGRLRTPTAGSRSVPCKVLEIRGDIMNLPAKMVVTALVAQRELDLLRETLRSEGIEVVHVWNLKQSVEDSSPVIVLDAEVCNPWTDAVMQVCLQRPD